MVPAECRDSTHDAQALQAGVWQVQQGAQPQQLPQLLLLLRLAVTAAVAGASLLLQLLHSCKQLKHRLHLVAELLRGGGCEGACHCSCLRQQLVLQD